MFKRRSIGSTSTPSFGVYAAIPIRMTEVAFSKRKLSAKFDVYATMPMCLPVP